MSTTAATTYLTHRATELPCPSTAAEDRTTVPGEVPTCGDCRQAFLAGYCPGFELWDVTLADGHVVRMAHDNRQGVEFCAGLDPVTFDRTRTVTAVRHLGANPAAQTWQAARR